jgi:hypothetical protein
MTLLLKKKPCKYTDELRILFFNRGNALYFFKPSGMNEKRTRKGMDENK